MRDHFKTAEILNTLGSYRFYAGDWPGAMAEFQQALVLAEQIGSEKAIAVSELNLGTAAIDLGHDEEAEKHLKQGLQLAQKTNQSIDVCICLLNLAELKLRQSQWEKADHFLQQAEQLNKQIEGERYEPLIRRGYAQVKQALGQMEIARDDAQLAVGLARKDGEDIELGICLRVLGEITFALAREQDALDHFEESISILKDAYPYEAARTQMQYGLALGAGNERKRGLNQLNEARAVFQRLDAQRDLASVMSHLSEY
jgi:tetratricopeptide (TPR) repeat protein